MRRTNKLFLYQTETLNKSTKQRDKDDDNNEAEEPADPVVALDNFILSPLLHTLVVPQKNDASLIALSASNLTNVNYNHLLIDQEI